MRRKSTKIIVGTIILTLIVSITFILYLFLYPNYRLKDGQEQFLYIYPKDTPQKILTQLQQKVDVQCPVGFEVVSKVLQYKNPRAGRYKIIGGANNLELIKTLRAGEQTPINLKIKSVRSVSQLTQQLSRQLMSDSTQLTHILTDSVFLASYKLNSDIATLFFIPNTYEVFWTITPKQLFERMQREYNSFWTKERKEKATNIPLTPTEVSILAAIVDSETHNTKEKPTIAGLYINRIRKGIPLQADPTVIFAVGDFSIRRVLISHTKTPSPYNTYLNKGLPPGLIRTPSISGIDAVLNYQKSNYVFMCASEDFDGTHDFAVSWSEHLANARKYQKALNKRGIK